jgi:phage gpG-like protein
MSDEITVQFNAEAFLARLAGQGDQLLGSLRSVVNRLSITVQGAVKEGKLTGQVLHVRTGTLRRSINRVVTESENAIHASVGTNIVYGAIHEFGFQGAVDVRAYVRGDGAAVSAHTRQVNLPARSFLRSTLAERESEITSTLRAEVLGSLRQLKGAS